MGTNPYEAPQADIGGGAGAQASAAGAAAKPLPPELEMKAMELLGQKRSRLTGISFAVAGAVCVGILTLLLGLLLALIVGGALAGIIARAFVKSKTEALADEVCAELGLPRGSFRPDTRYLL